MPRYFIELAYNGGAYRGFQKQPNAATIQWEVEKALQILSKQNINLTGSSRTDSGVHAVQNYFHFDTTFPIDTPQYIYRLNAILPEDISIKNIRPVADDAHCRFSAVSRSYEYHLYRKKNPFLTDWSFFYPFQLNIQWLNEAAAVLFTYTDFTSFSKRNTQVKSFLCNISEAQWKQVNDELVFCVTANRFLRGMVRGLTGTMLRRGRGLISLNEFTAIIESKDCRRADFSVPPEGLFLTAVSYPASVWKEDKNDELCR